ncbi:Nucleoside-diphosphate sugar epimerase [Streptomyces graminofaciens]|uniref:Nucleoside-diphosphate sugar epimerase n=1 Tax=Streptomyces graminofaciens TaxID=68212 RepID=A0ABM8HKI4_9ACTN|nr:Nucleoside-diphosphate sugar epimerase [Streptomyces graminofaciens]
MTNDSAKGTFGAADRLPMKGNPTISRADVAAFMHKAAHGTEWIHRSPVLTD